MSTAELIMYIVIICGVGMIMLGIGIWQLRAKEPVAFYTGEIPPRPSQLSDVNMWNKKHGLMWALYGVAIIVSGLLALFMRESVVPSTLSMGVIILGIPVMIFYHTHLRNKYLKENEKETKDE